MVKQDKRKKILIQVVCILISFGLWVYINAIENPTSQRTIKNIPVEIQNIAILAQDGLALAPNQNLTVNLGIKGPNEAVFNSTASDYRVILQLGNTQLTEGSNWLTAQIVSSPTGITVTNQLIKVNLKLEQLVKKDFPVQSNLTITTASGVYVKNVALTPSEVMVEGASSAVDSVSKVVAVQKVGNLSANETVNAKLVALNAQGQELNDVNIYPGTISAEISTYNGKSVPINVVTTGDAKAGINIESLVPDIKTVEVIGDSDVINGITAINTEPINISDISSNEVIPIGLIIPQGVTLKNNISTVNVTANTVESNTTNSTTNNSNQENNEQSNTQNNTNNTESNSANDNTENKTNALTQIQKTFTVPITITGEKSGYKYTLSSTSATVILSGTEKLINSVNTSSLLSSINVSNIESSSSEKLSFNLESGVTLVSTTPKEITITAVKNATKESTSTNENTK